MMFSFSTSNVPSFNPATGAWVLRTFAVHLHSLYTSILFYFCGKLIFYLRKMDSGTVCVCENERRDGMYLGDMLYATYVCLCHADISNLSFYLFLTSLTYLWSVGLIFSLSSILVFVFCCSCFFGEKQTQNTKFLLMFMLFLVFWNVFHVHWYE